MFQTSGSTRTSYTSCQIRPACSTRKPSCSHMVRSVSAGRWFRAKWALLSRSIHRSLNVLILGWFLTSVRCDLTGQDSSVTTPRRSHSLTRGSDQIFCPINLDRWATVVTGLSGPYLSLASQSECRIAAR